MTYTPRHIANYMLERAEQEGRPISNMKLQKLVYIAYGWALAVLDRKLFEEPIQAWQHGPVVPSLYHEFKHFRQRDIAGRAMEYDFDTADVTIPNVDETDERLQTVLDRVWDTYKPYSAVSLRNMTHRPGTPWSETYEQGRQDITIPDSLIKPHFESKIRQYLDDAKAAS